MRFLLIAMLSLAAWFGPASASATQVQSPPTVTAISMWATPLVPGAELDPSDPQVLDRAGSALIFMTFSSGDTSLPESLDNFYFGMIEPEPADDSPATVQELFVPLYGEKSRAVSMVDDGFLFDALLGYDDKTIYMLMAIATERSPSAMPILTGIADQMFDPARPDHSTVAARAFLEEFAPALGESYEPLLIRLPQRAEVPAEYQLLEEEVIIS